MSEFLNFDKVIKRSTEDRASKESKQGSVLAVFQQTLEQNLTQTIGAYQRMMSNTFFNAQGLSTQDLFDAMGTEAGPFLDKLEAMRVYVVTSMLGDTLSEEEAAKMFPPLPGGVSVKRGGDGTVVVTSKG